ncbi:competence/damage-inducible protein A [Anaerosalibacter bizertensis]|uniref:Putative competence-damage inducible protein n=1 Tax=Anaerosalibacter bizertensis TaxID=932217 RepID=A0A844FG55_9FIRM|nr:competence/damage-inducible protein A [Anaerosalibacter bizertensis]MBV1818838.1 competence/damage-inducible protein A [Bacteroidales bacterium MSK.15.36]MBU5293238.1 competence/damage-inducible protein A [Anaerosalibacter bizertensis]MCG4564595.1 competence/damage-inducible protein A [Anaerosalibacter bizertensis]MCG4583264.1 competence/damage-inducible protein A [Anaerosalibacter bizertensis]MSS42948.1 competence/damage-inducible protein A [Anaerosalibacter bizertensis]
MKSEIISVGSELLLGNTVNTNASFLSRKLAELGIDVFYHTVVGDNVYRLKTITKIALDRSDLIIYTGGLGPTEDDLTKEVVSETLGVDLELDNVHLAKIKKYFEKRNMKMTDNNIKQAYIIKDSKVLNNDIGTAPGVFFNWKDKKIILLPGPPTEMKTMFNNYTAPLLKQDSIIKSKTIRTMGIGESSLEELIKDLVIEQSNPTIATYAKQGQVEIQVTGKGKNEKEIDLIIDPLVKEIDKRLGEYIYSYNNESIEEVFFKQLKKNHMTVAFCESCTGGLVSSRFTAIPGASQVFERGIVTYTNNSKIEELNVKESTLKTYGAVSEETAKEMSIGLLNKTNVDMALSITGIAGPTGGTKDKPVGLVYIGLASKDKSYVIKNIFTGSRQDIQNKAANKVFVEGRKYLLEINN